MWRENSEDSLPKRPREPTWFQLRFLAAVAVPTTARILAAGLVWWAPVEQEGWTITKDQNGNIVATYQDKAAEVSVPC